MLVIARVHPAQIITDGLAGYWKFDETSGDLAADSSGNGNNAELRNYEAEETKWVEGRAGGALQFGGPASQNYALVSNYPKSTGKLTVAAWVWAESRPAWATIAKNWGTSAGQFHFGLTQNEGDLSNYLSESAGASRLVREGRPFPVGSWEHVAVVADGTALILYRNGARIESIPYDGTVLETTIQHLGIGAKVEGNSPDAVSPGYWHGKIDDLAIWNRDLSPDEITAIHRAGEVGKDLTQADLNEVFEPRILTQPQELELYEDEIAQFELEASGTGLSYQWFKGATAIATGTGRLFSIESLKLTDAGEYWVRISNPKGTVESNRVRLIVKPRYLPARLVSEWRFENNLNDTSANGNHGSAFGQIEYVDGRFGKGVKIGSDSHLANDAANNLPAKADDQWSINLWVNLDSPPPTLGFVAGFGPVQDILTGSARALLSFAGTENNGIYAWGQASDTSSTGQYPVGRWGMVTVTHDGADGTTKIFLDGEKVGENQAPRSDIPVGEHRITLAKTSNWSAKVSGAFDEFTVWRGVLNASQIQDLLSGGPGLVAKKIAEWKFENNLEDSSGHENHGSSVGSVEFGPGAAGRGVKVPVGASIIREAARELPVAANSSWSINFWANFPAPPPSLAYIAGFGPDTQVPDKMARAFLAFSGTDGNNIFSWGSNADTPSQAEYPVNRWGMVTLTHNGTDGTTTIYADGVNVTQNIAKRENIPAGQETISISPPGNWDVEFEMWVDEFTVWKGELTPAQVAELAANRGPDPVAIVTQPQDLEIFEGQPLRLVVSATGTAPLSYRWLKNGIAMEGITTPVIDISEAALNDSGTYMVEITNPAGTVSSEPVNVVVNRRPTQGLILVSEWKFENQTTDTSGLGNDGNASGDFEFVPGKFGTAIRLGTDAVVEKIEANGLPKRGSDSWSLNLWVKLESAPSMLSYIAGFGPVLDTGAGQPRGLIAFSGSDNNNIYVWGSNRDTSTSGEYPVGDWGMVTVTHDGLDGGTIVYLNGQKIATGFQPRNDIPTGHELISLAPVSNWNQKAVGRFDEFTVWRGVLSPAQAMDLYTSNTLPLLLRTKFTPQGLELTWAENLTGVTLQATTSLTQPDWQAVPGVQGNRALVEFSSPARFFRLQK